MVLEELGAYLQDEGLGTLGMDLFLGALPPDIPEVDTPGAVAALVPTPGFPAIYVHDLVDPAREQPVIQILVRGEPYDYAAAQLWATEIWLALGRIRNQALSGTFYLGVTPLQSIMKLRDDDFERPMMTAQFRIDKAVSALP